MKPASIVLTTITAAACLGLSTPLSQAVVLANFNFAAVTGNAASTISSASTVTGSGYTVGPFSGGTGLQGSVPNTGAITATSTTGSANTQHLVVRVGGTDATSRADEAGAITANDFYGFTITPDAGAPLSLTSLSFQLGRSGTFSGRVFVRSSLDGYATTLFSDDLTSATTTLVSATPIDLTAGFADLTEAVTFRFYFADNSASITDADTTASIVYRIDNITLEGVPEPASAVLLGAAGIIPLVRRRRA